MTLVAVAHGRWSPVARLFGAVEATLAALGAVLEPERRDEGRRQGAATCAALGQEAFATAWAEGRTMGLEEAVALTLGD